MIKIDEHFTIKFSEPCWEIQYDGKSIMGGFTTEASAGLYLVQNIMTLTKRMQTKAERVEKIKLDKTTEDLLKFTFKNTLESITENMLDHYRAWKKAMDDHGFKVCGGSDKAWQRFKRLPMRHKLDFDRALSLAQLECPNYMTKEKA
jgi:hypothetical protein